MFEVVSVYFPITFSPPPGDPRGVSQQDLVSRLRYYSCLPSASSTHSVYRLCFSSSSVFAPFVFPFLIEKIGVLCCVVCVCMMCVTVCIEESESMSVSSIRDCMETLRICCQNYTISAVTAWLPQIWNSLLSLVCIVCCVCVCVREREKKRVDSGD